MLPPAPGPTWTSIALNARVGERCAINGPGGHFELIPSSLEDCLFGTFGGTLPLTLRIQSYDVFRPNLNAAALIEWSQSGSLLETSTTTRAGIGSLALSSTAQEGRGQLRGFCKISRSKRSGHMAS